MSKRYGFVGVWAVVALTVGCTTRAYRAYEGEKLPPDQVVVVEVSPEIDVLKVEGRSRIGLRVYMPGRSDRLELLPGTNTVVARYSTIYGTERDDHEAFYSKSVPITFAADAGSRYRIAHAPVPKNPVEEHVSRVVDLWVEDMNGIRSPTVPKPAHAPVASEAPKKVSKEAPEKVRASTEPPAAEVVESGVSRVAPAEVTESTSTEADPAEPPEGVGKDETLETLNLLKFWWERADEEERRAFLRWVEP